MLSRGPSGKYLFQIYLHLIDCSAKSPESSLIPIFFNPASTIAFATMIVFSIPDPKVEYVSINVT